MKRENVLKEMARIVKEIEVERVYPGPHNPSKNDLVTYCCKLPRPLVESWKKLRGAQNHNLERAIRAYLMLMEQKGRE